MKTTYKTMKVRELFDVQSGSCHAISELDAGSTPLISCGDLNNGLVGYHEIPDDETYERAITVAYNGSWPLTTKFHPYKFGAKDDVAVLVPLKPMTDAVMLYVAASLNRMVWRYSYGRKCFKEKLQGVDLRMPVMSRDGAQVIDDSVPESLLGKARESALSGARRSIESLFPAAIG